MKPWLHDILACPICKFYPLDLTIFSYENDEDFFKELLDNYTIRDLNYHLNEKIPNWIEEENQIYIKDNIIIEKTNIKEYFSLIKSSLEELNYVNDNTSYKYSKKCFNLAKTDIKNKILKYSESLNQKKIDDILPELNFINRLKIEIEIDKGLLFCSQCNRWYPIIDTIPFMLPCLLYTSPSPRDRS